VRRILLRRALAGGPPVEVQPPESGVLHPFTTTDVVIRRFRVALPGWTGPAFRIAHLSDLHVTPCLPESYYRRVLEMTEGVQADLVFLTGDFVSRVDAVPALARLLRPLGRIGTYAVLGNHDYWVGADEIRAALQEAGIRPLGDETVQTEVGGGTVRITGCEHPWSGRGCAVPAGGEGTLRLVLSHTPDNIYRLTRQSAHMVFSGHNHAGQLRIPWLGSVIVPSRYGRRFDHGHFVVNGTHLFVTSGVGAAHPPLRVYCHPDIFVVEVTGEEEVSGFGCQVSAKTRRTTSVG
jgi:hypothetical protein